MEEKVKKVTMALHAIGAIKFGEFKLKSGIMSPLYVDLRLIVSYPKLLADLSALLWEKIVTLPKDLLCGVPYAALPLATALSLAHNIPMVMRRKEAKAYGTGKIIEGSFCKGDRCVVIDDLITSGLSLLETVAPLQEEGIIVQDFVVLVDREQGGKAKVEAKGYRLHSIFTIGELLRILVADHKISEPTYHRVTEFLAQTQV